MNSKKENSDSQMNLVSSEFSKLGLDPSICESVHKSGYETPTEIQKLAIPQVLYGKDLFASADTGTGKTAAFVLPCLQKLLAPAESNSNGPRILVLSPTRELASQITTAAKKYGGSIVGMHMVSILGGMSYEMQRKSLRKPIDIMVATPGRLLDHHRSGKMDFSRVEVLILDEADRMLDMGFFEDVKIVAKALPQNRQTLLFSATLNKKVLSLASTITKDPIRIEIKKSAITNDNVQQYAVFAEGIGHKKLILKSL